jgi:F-type H+-transporting ATPase subunit b
MPLNINLQQILLHALNFVILFGAMYFLLYKPVKSFMDSRKAHYEKMDEDAKAVLAEAEKTKAGYEAQLKSADEEIARRQREANEALQHAVDERRAQAEQQAGEIMRKAREDEQAKGEISELMSAAAEKLVLSSTSDAYDKFLDTAEERKDNG